VRIWLFSLVARVEVAPAGAGWQQCVCPADGVRAWASRCRASAVYASTHARLGEASRGGAPNGRSEGALRLHATAPMV